MNPALAENILSGQTNETKKSNGYGFSGYIASRPVAGNRIPQHIQNLVIREYARKNNLIFNLSATEYNCSSCYLLLEQILNELDRLDGVILYSLFMLPERHERRHSVYQRIIEADCILHAAVEDYNVATWDDVDRIESIFRLNNTINYCPKTIYE